MDVRIGLTGGIASGKSAAATVLSELGAVVIDSDVLARAVVAPGTDGLAAVVQRFGSGVLAADGGLDRAALGALVFADPAARRDLEAVVHPRVRAMAAEAEQQAVTDAAGAPVVVVQVIPLLVETGQAENFDVVAVVDVEPQTQLRRLTVRDGSDETSARARIAAQASRVERLAAADVVWSNDGTPDELREQIERWWHGPDGPGTRV